MFRCICIIKNHNDSGNFSEVVDNAHSSKHVAVFTIYKILLIYLFCVFVGLDKKKT